MGKVLDSGERDQLLEWARAKGPAGLEAYQREKNVSSIAGLPTPMAGTLPA